MKADEPDRRFIRLFLLSAVVLGTGIGLRDAWPPDEPRFALIALEMSQSGEWLIPHVGGVLYPDKPPLFFWITAIFYRMTGSAGVAVLLPSLLAGLAILWLVHDLARRLWDRDTAFVAALTLLTMVQFPLQMKSGQIDGLLCLWTTLGLYGFCRHLLLGPDWRWYAIGGLACGLGVITKGVGFLPFLVFFPWLLAARRGWPLPAAGRSARWLLAPAAALCAIGLWLVPMLVATGSSADLARYRDNILFRQTVTRYADAWGHLEPPWYLLTHAVPWLWLPVTLLLPWLIPAWITDIRERRAPTLLLGGWVLLILLFFSLSEGKRSVYILPAVPAVALLAGRHLAELLARRGPRRTLIALTLIVPALIAGAGIIALARPALVPPSIDPPLAADLARILAGIGIAAAATGLWLHRRGPLAGFAGAMVAIWLSVSLLVYPRIDRIRSGAGIIESATHAVLPDQILGFAGWKAQFLLQWNRPAVHFGYRRTDRGAESREAAAWLAGGERRRLVLPGDMLEPCFDRARLADLGVAHRQRWFLADPAAVAPGCRMPAPGATSIVHYDPAGSMGRETG